MFGKKDHTGVSLKYKVFDFPSSNWVTNVFSANNNLIFVDADRENTHTLFSYIESEELYLLLKNRPLSFEIHHPLKWMHHRDSEMVLRYERSITGFVLSYTYLNEKYYVGVIENDKFHTYEWDQNEPFLLDAKHAYLTEKVKINEKGAWIHSFKIPNDIQVKQAIHFNNDILLVTRNEIYLYKNNDEPIDLVYEGKNIAIDIWDQTSVIISDQNVQELFCFNMINRTKVETIMNHNHLYHFKTYDKKMIVGLPMYDIDGNINYLQGLKIII